MLPVSPPVILQELASVKDVIAKWVEAIAQGVPFVDKPGTEEELERYMRELCGELLLVAGKCSTLAEVLYGTRD